MSTILEALNRRYATKAYDTTKKVSDADLHTILEAMRLSPSSFGVQAWKFLVVTNEELRAKLKDASRGQPQITDASHVIVLTVKKDYTEKDADEYMQAVATTRGMDVNALNGFKQAILGAIQHRTQQEKQVWNSKQAYIALGIGLLTAAQLGIDSTPMEGFSAQQYDEILGLTNSEYTTAVVLTVGYRSADDATQNYAKVRFAAEQVIKYK